MHTSFILYNLVMNNNPFQSIVNNMIETQQFININHSNLALLELTPGRFLDRLIEPEGETREALF